MINPFPFLRRALQVDAIFSGVSALLLVFGASFLAPLTNLPESFLRNTGLYTGAEDPIHAQQIFLTNEMIQEFTARHKFPIWRIHQRLGDAIFVPAGCAHQVSQCPIDDFPFTSRP